MERRVPDQLGVAPLGDQRDQFGGLYIFSWVSVVSCLSHYVLACVKLFFQGCGQVVRWW